MVHCGYEPAAVEATFGSLGGLLATARLMLLGAPKTGVGPHAGKAHTPSPRPVAAPVGLRLQPNGLPSLPVIDRLS